MEKENAPKEQKPKTEQELMQEFANEYNELCKKHGFILTATPRWVRSQDTGDYRLTIDNSVVRLPKQQ